MVDTNLFIDRQTSGDGMTRRWPGGPGIVILHGAFDGASVSLWLSFDRQEFIPTGTDGTFTAAGARGFTLPPCVIRGQVATAGAGTDISMTIRRLE